MIQHHQVLAESEKPGYHPRLSTWVSANPDVIRQFFEAADKVRERGLTNYSAYVIVNVLRFRNDVRGSKFKMSNTFTPDLARLYNSLTNSELFKTASRFGKETGSE